MVRFSDSDCFFIGEYRILETEWLFVRARTDRILAIRTAYDHVTIQVVSRDELI